MVYLMSKIGDKITSYILHIEECLVDSYLIYVQVGIYMRGINKVRTKSVIEV